MATTTIRTTTVPMLDQPPAILHPIDAISTLESLITSRRSTRVFLPNPVPEHILRSALTLAQHSPSNSNIQPWRLKLASGPARDRIVAALSAAGETHGPNIPPLPEEYAHFRSAMGANLYGPNGYDCPRGDKERHRELQMWNFSFFDAPVVGVVYMDSQLSHMDAMTVGFFCQAFTLGLTARGLGCCWQVSVTGFPEVLGREFELDGEGKGDGGVGGRRILCGVAIGWPAEHPVNRVEMGREELEGFVEFLRE